MWKQEKLERRGFEDIFLPKSIMEDLRLYTTLHDKTGKLLRYLMIGNPGTGKTESTLAIANYLKDHHVTIIKTQVCDALKEKIELAELLAPSIVIFDDIDLSLGSRKKGMVSGGLAQFLDVLDGTEKIRSDVGIIATTNSLELLDMAAQRPGRFDKLLAFDSLTKGNIKNIILKSLNRNFEITAEDSDCIPFVHSSVVEKFFSSRVTGAHVYNTTKMLKLRIQTLELEDITAEWIVNEIKLELDTLSRIRRTDYLNATMNGNSSSEIGFPLSLRNSEPEEDDEDMMEVSDASPAGEEESPMTFAAESMEESKPMEREGDKPGGKIHRGGNDESSKDSGEATERML
jgi:SpoVK/Ycf46/Vps4 family AAA+-type ATPase